MYGTPFSLGKRTMRHANEYWSRNREDICELAVHTIVYFVSRSQTAEECAIEVKNRIACRESEESVRDRNQTKQTLVSLSVILAKRDGNSTWKYWYDRLEVYTGSHRGNITPDHLHKFILSIGFEEFELEEFSCEAVVKCFNYH